MSKTKNNTSIVYLDRQGLPNHIHIPPPSSAHHWVNYDSTNTAQLIERANKADILVINKVEINAETLDACPNLKHIAVTATGYNIIDIAACEARGISVSNVPSYAATTVSEHVIGASILLKREMARYAQSVADGQWQTSKSFCLFDKPFHNIEGSTIGLIGMGEIAQATAQKARALGMNVLFCTRSPHSHKYAKCVSLEHLLRHSDIVSVHCSLNETTKNLLGEHEIGLMPPHSILINTARGGIVDETAAVDAINTHSIAGLAFDVMITEPPSDNAPLLSVANLPNVLITPHIAWASEQAMQYLANTVSQNIDAFIQGQAINLVTKHVSQ